MVPVNITFEAKSVVTYAFLDQRSTQCFCGKTLVNVHDLRGDANEFMFQTLTGTKTHCSITASLSISLQNDDGNFVLFAVYSVSEEPGLNPVASKVNLERFSYLKDLSFPPISGAPVTLLIGTGNP